MINTQLKLPLSRTSFNGTKGVRGIEIRLYVTKVKKSTSNSSLKRSLTTFYC